MPLAVGTSEAAGDIPHIVWRSSLVGRQCTATTQQGVKVRRKDLMTTAKVKEWYETLPDEAVVYQFQAQLQIHVSTSVLQCSWQLGGDVWSLRLRALPLTRRHVSRG